MSTTITRTYTGAVRLRGKREHRALECLWWWANTLRNALCEQELGIRAHNRRVFLRHGTDWEPGPEDFASVLDEETSGKLIARPKRTALCRQWTEVTQDAREHPVTDGFDPLAFGRRMVVGVIDDYVRRYEGDGPVPAPKFRPGWKLDSVCVYEARVAWRDNRQDAVLRVQGLPALRVQLHRPVPDGAEVRGTVRIVRRQRGCRGQVPTRYEVRVMVDVAKRAEVQGTGRALAWDPGGRRSLTSSQGHMVVLKPRDRSETRRLQRAVARGKKRSQGSTKAKAMLRAHLERETRARGQHRHKQIHHAGRKAVVHVVEANRHAQMRRRGGKTKSRMNRSLAEAGPARTVQLLKDQCEKSGRRVVEAPAPYNSRTCSDCDSRNVRLTRSRLECRECGKTRDRDVNAALNALQWAVEQGAVPAPGGFNREVSARRGTAPAPQCPVPSESLGPAPVLARREASNLPGQHGREERKDICPCRKPNDVCPDGPISC